MKRDGILVLRRSLSGEAAGEAGLRPLKGPGLEGGISDHQLVDSSQWHSAVNHNLHASLFSARLLLLESSICLDTILIVVAVDARLRFRVGDEPAQKLTTKLLELHTSTKSQHLAYNRQHGKYNAVIILTYHDVSFNGTMSLCKMLRCGRLKRKLLTGDFMPAFHKAGQEQRLL